MNSRISTILRKIFSSQLALAVLGITVIILIPLFLIRFSPQIAEWFLRIVPGS